MSLRTFKVAVIEWLKLLGTILVACIFVGCVIVLVVYAVSLKGIKK